MKNKFETNYLSHSVKENEVNSENDIEAWKREGNVKLDNFIKEAKKPYNLFYIDQDLTREQLLERLALLDTLYANFKKADPTPGKERDEIEKEINQMFGVPTIPAEIQTFLSEMDKLSNERAQGYRFSEGAENKNYISQN